MKKIISIILILAIFIITACEKKEKKEDVSSNTNTLQGKVEIWTSGNSVDNLDVYINKFKEQHASVEINNTYVDENDIDQKINEVISSGKTMPDILIISEEAAIKIKKYAPELMDLSSDAVMLKDKSIRMKDESIYSNDKAIAIPFSVKPIAMLYRIDLFKDANIQVEDIKTWKDYIDAGKKILDHSGGAVKLLPLNVTSDIEFFNQLLNQLGGSYYDSGGKVLLNSQAAIKSMSILKDMSDSNLIYNVSNNNDIIQCAQNNSIASIISSSEIIPVITDSLKEQSGKWGVVNIPAFEPGGAVASVKGFTYIAMSKGAAENDAAIELKRFFYSDKEDDRVSIENKGVFPVMSQLYNEAFMDEKNVYFNNETDWRFLIELTKDVPKFPIKEQNSKIRNELIEAERNVLRNNKDIKESLQEIDAKMNTP